MATQPTNPAPLPQAQPRRSNAPPGLLNRWQARRANRRQDRLTSPRNRRTLARWLRRTTKLASDRRPIRRRHDVLLHDRAFAARFELLEIAAMLERVPDPEPDCVATLHDLLANGCASPLYNTDIHISELHATLHYVRSGL